ncbi:MAG: DNA repair protein RadC [Methylomarinum sp.]|nr:DNA repair protein RadC [Methylomarinum sp.]
MLKRTFNQRAKHDFEIREPNGFYRSATEDEILETALSIINSRFTKGTAITDPKQTHEFLKLELAHEEHELFAVLWLDTRHRIIDFETLFRGTIDAASVYPREVVKSALEHNAAACILCHNHPSGVAKPSQADKQITEKVKAALNLVDVRTLDHVLVAEETYSFAEHGIL